MKYGVYDAFHVGASPVPNADDIQSLGAASPRYAQAYVASGVISTSDTRQQSDMAGLPEALRAVGAALRQDIGAFRWNAAKEDKGGAMAYWVDGATGCIALSGEWS